MSLVRTGHPRRVICNTTACGFCVLCRAKARPAAVNSPVADIGTVDPLFAFALIQTFIDILKDYFGEVSALAIRENFDTVYQLLEEVLDDGYPLTTELSALRDIVLPPSFLKKVISAAGISGLSKSTTGHPFSSPIPWRKAGLKYNNNEIKFDVVEELVAIVNKYVRIADVRASADLQLQKWRCRYQCRVGKACRTSTPVRFALLSLPPGSHQDSQWLRRSRPAHDLH